MLKQRPFSLSAFHLIAGLQRADLRFETIVDVGANIGQFTAAARHAWPQARLLAFEPLADAAERLRRLAGVEVHQVAIGDHDGATVFHPHAYSLSSSALSVAIDQRHQRWAKAAAPIEVPMRRLDTVLAEYHLEGPMLLKLDVQGLELAVIAGAPATLARADAVVLEVAFQRSYEDQPLFPDVHRALEEAGWSGVQPLDWRIEAGRIVEADMLYLRSGCRRGSPSTGESQRPNERQADRPLEGGA